MCSTSVSCQVNPESPSGQTDRPTHSPHSCLFLPPPTHTQVAHAPLRAGFSLAPVSRSEKPLPKRREGACESGPPPSGRSPMGAPIPLDLSTELDTFSHRLLKALLGPLLAPVSVARSHHTWALNPNKPNKERSSTSHRLAAGPAMKMGTWQLMQEMTCPCSHKQQAGFKLPASLALSIRCRGLLPRQLGPLS